MIASLIAIIVTATGVFGAGIAPGVLQQIDLHNSADCLIIMNERADLSPARLMAHRSDKCRFVSESLRETARTSQADLLALLDSHRLMHRSYWIQNMIHVRLDQELLTIIAKRSDVRQIRLNARVVAIDPEERISKASDNEQRTVGWNINQIRASEVWSELGVTGEGIVVCDHDTGVDWEHGALKSQYRGWDGTTADHNYNWFDATGTSPTVPIDDNGHGTHTTGTMVGDDGAANQIGVAPGAKWVGVKCMDADGGGETVWFHAGFQWILAPTDLTGANPDPSKAPHAINNSWGYPGNDPEFYDDLVALDAAGIFVEVSAGNEGPQCGTLRSPGDYDNAFTTGSTNQGGLLSSFSSRGPSALYPGIYKPDVIAPGSNIRSSTPGGGFGVSSGTSMAGPHVTGMIALLWSANPSLIGDIDSTREIITETALATDTNECDSNDRTVPNNAYGHGEIDCYRAVISTLAPVSEGRIFLSRSRFGCLSTIGLRVTDADLAGTVSLVVQIRSTTETSPVAVTLGETDPGVFMGQIQTEPGAPAPDAELQVQNGDEVTATYNDANHGGSPLELTETAIIDCLPPVISNVAVDMISSSSMTITWDTDEPATTALRYGEAVPLVGMFSQSRLGTSHSVTITNLASCTTYLYSVESTDEAANVTVDDNGGNYYTGKTYQRVVGFAEPMNTDPGWTISGGQWAFGVPSGNAGDPTSGHSGNSVYGYNLNGAYENDMPVYSLISPVIDCSEAIDTTVFLSLWLNVDTAAHDHASWDVSTDGGTSWITLWQNENYPMEMDFWYGVEAPAGGLIDGHSQVAFRWTMGPTDSTVVMGGWNIDDFRIEYDVECEDEPPTPTPTSTPAIELGVRIELPEMAHPGEIFSVTGYLDNPGEALAQVPVFFVLDVFGEYWFWPSWVHFEPETQLIDFRYMDIPTGTTTEFVIPEFIWPDTGSATVEHLRFLGAMLTQDMSTYLGMLALEEFGYGPNPSAY